MLRACHAVLRPGGRIAGYTIHTAPMLDTDALERAAELGPPEILASASPPALLRSAGFTVLDTEDVTSEFAQTARAIMQARAAREQALRAEEGDTLFEDEQRGKRHVLAGIDEGLIRRSLHVGLKG